MSQMIIKMINN